MSRLGTPLAVATLAFLATLTVPHAPTSTMRDAPVISKIDQPTRAKLITTLRRGERLGNRADVFAKVGDSLSQSPAFAQPLGCGRWMPGSHRSLRRTVRRFAARALPGKSSYCRRVNSFSRNSAATLARQTSHWPLEPGASQDPSCRPAETPLVCEIRRTRPGYAVILLGSNDVKLGVALGLDPLPSFVANISHLVGAARSRGVVPVLTTIPPQADERAEAAVEQLNNALQMLAQRRGLPLLDLWRALSGLPNRGLSEDGLHLTVYGGPCAGTCDPNTCAPACQPANFSAAGTRYGMNVRNLTTVALLRRLSGRHASNQDRPRP